MNPQSWRQWTSASFHGPPRFPPNPRFGPRPMLPGNRSIGGYPTDSMTNLHPSSMPPPIRWGPGYSQPALTGLWPPSCPSQTYSRAPSPRRPVPSPAPRFSIPTVPISSRSRQYDNLFPPLPPHGEPYISQDEYYYSSDSNSDFVSPQHGGDTFSSSSFYDESSFFSGEGYDTSLPYSNAPYSSGPTGYHTSSTYYDDSSYSSDMSYYDENPLLRDHGGGTVERVERNPIARYDDPPYISGSGDDMSTYYDDSSYLPGMTNNDESPWADHHHHGLEMGERVPRNPVTRYDDPLYSSGGIGDHMPTYYDDASYLPGMNNNDETPVTDHHHEIVGEGVPRNKPINGVKKTILKARPASGRLRNLSDSSLEKLKRQAELRNSLDDSFVRISLRCPGADTPQKLYHYTTEEGAFGILSDRFFRPKEIMGDLLSTSARFGNGIYFTHIPPKAPTSEILMNNYNRILTTELNTTEYCFEFLSKELPQLFICDDSITTGAAKSPDMRKRNIWMSKVSKLELKGMTVKYHVRELDGSGVPRSIKEVPL